MHCAILLNFHALQSYFIPMTPAQFTLLDRKGLREAGVNLNVDSPPLMNVLDDKGNSPVESVIQLMVPTCGVVCRPLTMQSPVTRGGSGGMLKRVTRAAHRS